jgi:hypothetical protein
LLLTFDWIMADQSTWYRQQGDLAVAPRSLFLTSYWLRIYSTDCRQQVYLTVAAQSMLLSPHWVTCQSTGYTQQVSSDSRHLIRVAHVSLVADMSVKQE